jgi:putative redox protein
MAEVNVLWKDNMNFEAIGKRGNKVLLGNPVDDNDKSVTGPMELLLMSLGGCTGMDIISILKKERQEVTGLNVKVTGERAEEYPKIYKHIVVEYIVSGKNLSYDKVKKAVDLSKDKYCSVSIALKESAKIDHIITIKNE